MMKSAFDYLGLHADRTPDKVAIISRKCGKNYTRTTYSQLYNLALRYAHDIKVSTTTQNVIPVFTQRSTDMVACILGAIASGKCAAPLNNKLKVPQINDILKQAEAEIAFLDNAGLMSCRNAELSIDFGTCEWKWIDHENGSVVHHNTASKLRSNMRLSKWQGDQPGANTLIESAESAEGIGVCLFTSGSTGMPKGVLIKNADLVNRANAEAEWYGICGEDVLLNILPFSFDVGLNQLLSTIVAGCTMVILESWLPADIIDTVSEHNVTGISGVPSIWQDFINQKMKFVAGSNGNNSKLRYITVSGGDLSRTYLEQLPRIADNLLIYKTYGQTEAFRLTSLRPEMYHEKLDSVGLPFTGVCVLVLRDDGSLAGANEVGEIVHIGLGAMHSYLDEKSTGEKKRPNPYPTESYNHSHAIYTGDYGYLDEEGYLYLKGRKDSMLKVSGNRVYPSEIEAQILSVQEIHEAAVIGVRNKSGGYELIAFVVLHKEGIELMEIQRELSQKLPSYMIPKRLEIRESLPRTASGKPDLIALQREAERKYAIIDKY